MPIIRIIGGKKLYTPTRDGMLSDIDRMDRVFPPGIVINRKEMVPPCAAEVLQVLGRGLLQVLKDFLTVQLAATDAFLAAARATVVWLENVENMPEKLLAEQMNGVAGAARQAYRDKISQITSQVSASRGKEFSNQAVTALYTCPAVQMLLAELEAVSRLPERLLHKYMVLYKKKVTVLNNYKLAVLWLEARKRFYQNWVNSLDVFIV